MCVCGGDTQEVTNMSDVKNYTFQTLKQLKLSFPLPWQKWINHISSYPFHGSTINQFEPVHEKTNNLGSDQV